jgi:hypothetical protein
MAEDGSRDAKGEAACTVLYSHHSEVEFPKFATDPPWSDGLYHSYFGYHA